MNVQTKIIRYCTRNAKWNDEIKNKAGKTYQKYVLLALFFLFAFYCIFYT